MKNSKRRRNAETSLIYLAAACLAASLVYLVSSMAVPVSVPATDPFPDLYAPARSGEAFITPSQKTVYFTFDDGPSEKNTERILDILAEEEVKATFFVTGQTAEEPYSAQHLNRMMEEGHTIGLHTYTHEFSSIYAYPDAYLADLDRLRQYLADTTGYTPEILRFPGGSLTSNASKETMGEIIREVTRRGYLYYDWNVVSGDETATVFPAEDLTERILQQADGLDKVIVLFHDSAGPATTPDALRLSIHAFREQGYAFDRLTPQTEPIQLRSPVSA